MRTQNFVLFAVIIVASLLVVGLSSFADLQTPAGKQSAPSLNTFGFTIDAQFTTSAGGVYYYDGSAIPRRPGIYCWYNVPPWSGGDFFHCTRYPSIQVIPASSDNPSGFFDCDYPVFSPGTDFDASPHNVLSGQPLYNDMNTHRERARDKARRQLVKFCKDHGSAAGCPLPPLPGEIEYSDTVSHTYTLVRGEPGGGSSTIQANSIAQGKCGMA